VRSIVVRCAGSTTLAVLLAIASATHAQSFPSKPVRFVLGPGQDMVARLVSQKLSDAWRQQVIVDQRAGGAGVNSVEIAGRAPEEFAAFVRADVARWTKVIRDARIAPQ